MGNSKLSNAKKEKNDEFYTQYNDIEKEISTYLDYNSDVFRGKTVLLPCDNPEWSNFTKFFVRNFKRLGLKKLISTSYEINKNGKIFTLIDNKIGDGKINIDDLECSYLKGDGDFKSDEVKVLCNEADIIVTNPPFSLFREFIMWLVKADKQFLLIGNMNAITYKEVFPLIKENKIWLGATNFNKGMYFQVSDDFIYNNTYKFKREQNGVKVNRVAGVCWFTNIEHGRRHQPMSLMTMVDNIKFSKHKELNGKEYVRYVNFDAIDVPFTNSIPKDYRGVMGVPKSFMGSYCVEQFKILGYEREDENIKVGIHHMPEEFLSDYRKQGGRGHYTKGMKMLCCYDSDEKAKIPFSRILIKYTEEWIESHTDDFKQNFRS